MTRSRRYDWLRAIGVEGRWLIPDYPAVARDHDGVHVTARLRVPHVEAVVPIALGRGERVWDGLEGVHEWFDVQSVTMPSGVTHHTFGRRRPHQSAAPAGTIHSVR